VGLSVEIGCDHVVGELWAQLFILILIALSYSVAYHRYGGEA